MAVGFTTRRYKIKYKRPRKRLVRRDNGKNGRLRRSRAAKYAIGLSRFTDDAARGGDDRTEYDFPSKTPTLFTSPSLITPA